MNPEKCADGASYALLASGASFSCEVLRALIRRRHPPSLLVLPEYPPAARDERELITDARPRRLLQIGKNLELAYAPAEQQDELAAVVRQTGLQFLLVACWPYLIAPRLIESPAGACLNLHPSLLPAWRGPNPLQQQTAAGDSRFGVSLHLLDQQFDHGDIVAQSTLPALPAERGPGHIEKQCARRGADLFIEAMASFPHWRLVAQEASPNS